LGCDRDLVEAGREQQKGFEVAMTHGPSLLGKQGFAQIVTCFDEDMTLILFQGGIADASARHENASLIDLGHFVCWEVVKLDHCDFRAADNYWSNLDGRVG
jgi:hypothetical protein